MPPVISFGNIVSMSSFQGFYLPEKSNGECESIGYCSEIYPGMNVQEGSNDVKELR